MRKKAEKFRNWCQISFVQFIISIVSLVHTAESEPWTGSLEGRGQVVATLALRIVVTWLLYGGLLSTYIMYDLFVRMRPSPDETDGKIYSSYGRSRWTDKLEANLGTRPRAGLVRTSSWDQPSSEGTSQ